MRLYLHVFYLPCGCLVEHDRHGEVYERMPIRHLVECYWCGAVFDVRDLQAWFGDEPWPVNMAPIPPQLVQFGSTLLEVMSQCGKCSAPRVRRFGDRRDVPLFCLQVPSEIIQVVRN